MRASSERDRVRPVGDFAAAPAVSAVGVALAAAVDVAVATTVGLAFAAAGGGSVRLGGARLRVDSRARR